MVTKSISLGIPGVQLAPGDHVCAFYPSSKDRDDVLIPYLSSGLEAGDKCLAVVDSSGPESVVAALNAEGDFRPCLVQRQIDVQRSEETYLSGGSFSTEAMLDFWDLSIADALASGFDFIRLTGEMTWALRQMPGADELVRYEARLNQFLPRYPQVTLCLYALDSFRGEVLVDVLKTHPRVLLGGVVLDNPYYLQPDEFLAMWH